MSYKVLVNLILLGSFLIVFYIVQISKESDGVNYSPRLTKVLFSNSISVVTNNVSSLKNSFQPKELRQARVSVVDKYFNVWCIFTKVKNKISLKYKFSTMITSVLLHSTVKISFHVLTDPKSKHVADKVFEDVYNSSSYQTDFKVHYHDVRNVTSQLSELTATMLPYFSSQPGAYYSDALFFISLGLHKVAPPTQSRAILLDVDIKLVDDIALLFQEFNKFEERAVLGIAAELSPVYQHILFQYRNHNKHTKFGSPLSMGGFPGVNSGVLLLDFDRLRASTEYKHLLSPRSVKHLVTKYSFKGHLGDQDWYTLVGMDRPHLIHMLPCGWNRQLCDWWREHGYRDVFDSFAHCGETTHLYHGNCNTPLPRD